MMPLMFQSKITTQDMNANPRVRYLFGDNTNRTGYGGQASVMRGRPNAIGIATKWFPTMEPRSLFDDKDYDRIMQIVMEDFMPAWHHVASGGVVVCPLAGLGTHRAKLPERAPKILALIRRELLALSRI